MSASSSPFDTLRYREVHTQDEYLYLVVSNNEGTKIAIVAISISGSTNAHDYNDLSFSKAIIPSFLKAFLKGLLFFTVLGQS